MSIVRFDDSAENHPDFASGWTWWPTQPKQSSISQGGGKLQVESEPGRDWWRKPGHDAKDGEAFVRLLPPSHFGKDFSASVVMSGDWKAQYDQGTIFLYVLEDGGSSRWVKVGVEREDDKDWIGSVVTTQWSDWAIFPPSGVELNNRPVYFKIAREGHMLSITSSLGDKDQGVVYKRDVNGFYDGLSVSEMRIGIMACQPNPKAEGVKVSFEDFRFEWKN